MRIFWILSSFALATAAQAGSVTITIRTLAGTTPVKSEVFNKSPGKAESWLQDTADNGVLQLVDHACGEGEVFQARPKLPGYVFSADTWKRCQAGPMPFEYSRVQYAADLSRAVAIALAYQPADQQSRQYREVFLKSYDSGQFIALALASSKLEKTFKERGDAGTAKLFGTMTLEALQRGTGIGTPLMYDGGIQGYALPAEARKKLATSDLNFDPDAKIDDKLIADMIKTFAAKTDKTWLLPEALIR